MIPQSKQRMEIWSQMTVLEQTGAVPLQLHWMITVGVGPKDTRSLVPVPLVLPQEFASIRCWLPHQCQNPTWEDPNTDKHNHH